MEGTDTWPAAPATAWAESRTPPRPPEDRPAPPDIARYEGFLRHVVIVRVHLVFALLLTVAAVVMAAVALSSPDPLVLPSEVVGAVAWGAAGVCAAGAPVLALVGRRAHRRVRRNVYEQALRNGVVCDAFPTGYRVPAGDGHADVALYVDVRMGAEQAGRLRGAVAAWVARLEADEAADRAAGERLRSLGVHATDRIFGPEAAGGFLARDDGPLPGWRLVLPDEAPEPGADPLRTAEVYPIEDGTPLGHPRRRPPGPIPWAAVLDMAAAVLVAASGGVGWWLFNGWATRSNAWWNACADDFCAMGHDLRLFGLSFLTWIFLAVGLVAPGPFARRRLRWLWALLMASAASLAFAGSVVTAWYFPIE
ncbi:hypothetical protein LG943_24035 [Streptomonospora sp. S1-112]|uniref:Uncharacterized protein n=1 Tax=Streptomonospora mangrovi TaxID=2883123 RepID=A0A9X3NP92_9ACTN|nr:hypothetical protein [Streptomonospora mangrovi]MDA0567367.1 hypothetical protein [Streptomonospora mangrovi]